VEFEKYLLVVSFLGVILSGFGCIFPILFQLYLLVVSFLGVILSGFGCIYVRRKAKKIN